MIPLPNRLIRPINERFDLPVREASVIQECGEDTLFGGGVLTAKYFPLAGSFDHAVEHFGHQSEYSTAFSLSLRLTPLTAGDVKGVVPKHVGLSAPSIAGPFDRQRRGRIGSSETEPATVMES